MIISILLFISVLFTMAGFIQAQEPPPVPAPPTVPAATPETPTASSMATFNGQVYLMDRYASSPEDFPAPKVTSNNVPHSFPPLVLNNFLQADKNKMMDWLTKITPAEYAQLVPSISLSVVDIAKGTEAAIPLVENSDIDGGLASEYWYTNKTIGVKSFDMKLDGNSNPVGGKIYNITLKLTFDSINTFFTSIPSIPALKYSDVFRSQGPAGSPLHKYKVKLTVSYDGPQALITKYALNSPGLAFSSYLTLLTSELSLEENLSSTVSATYQGYEESLFNNGGVFDWLRVDMETIMADMNAKLAQARATLQSTSTTNVAEMQRHTREINEIPPGGVSQVNAARESIVNHPNNIPSQTLQNTVQEIASHRRQILGSGQATIRNDRHHYRQIAELQRRQVAAMAVTFRGANQAGLEIESPTTPDGQKVDFNKNFNDMTGAEREAVSSYVESGAYMNQNMRNRIANHATAIALGAGKEEGSDSMAVAKAFGTEFANAHLGGINDTSPQNALHRLENAAASANGRFRRNAAAGDQHQANLVTGFRAEMQNKRMTAIREALEDAIFNHSANFHKIEITSQDIQNYIMSITTLTPKDYSSPPIPTPAPESATDASYSALTQENVVAPESGTPNGLAAAQKATEDLRDAQRSLRNRNTSMARLRSDGPNYVPPHQLAPNRVAASRKTSEEQHNKRIADLEQEIKPLQEAVATAERNLEGLSQNLAVLGTKAAIEAKLNDFKTLEFIYLGDLMSLLMKRLKSLSLGSTTSTIQRKSIEKTLIALTEIKLQVLNSWLDRPLYKFPISITQLQKLLADKLYGNQRGTYTIFELFKDLSNIIKLSQQRKAKLMQHYGNNDNNYSVKFIPMPIIGASPNYKIASDKEKDEDKIKHAIIAVPRETAQSMPTAGNNPAITNRSNRIPHLHLGGTAFSVVKSIKMSQISDSDMMKVQFKRNQGGDSGGIIPVLYKVELVLMGSPFFHLGTYFYLDTATLNLRGNSAWFHLKGYYQVYELNHSFSVGSGYETHVTGLRQHLVPPSGASIPASQAATHI